MWEDDTYLTGGRGCICLDARFTKALQSNAPVAGEDLGGSGVDTGAQIGRCGIRTFMPTH